MHGEDKSRWTRITHHRHQILKTEGSKAKDLLEKKLCASIQRERHKRVMLHTKQQELGLRRDWRDGPLVKIKDLVDGRTDGRMDRWMDR